MPSYTRGLPRDVLTFVPLNAVLYYGWKTIDLAARTGLSSADLTTQLGHIDSATALGNAGAILVTGANSPKPARVTKKDPTAPVSAPASTSTYIAFDKAAAATSAGWTLSTPARGVKLTANVDGKRSVTAIAELSNGALYAFPLNKADFTTYAVALGLQDATSVGTVNERNRLVTGSKTKPGVASIAAGNGLFSTYYSSAAMDTALAAGFNLESDEFVEYA